jgi:hypothetical protein
MEALGDLGYIMITFAKINIPRTHAKLDALTTQIVAYGTVKMDPSTGTWKDIPQVFWTEFISAYNIWKAAYAAVQGDHTRVQTQEKNDARDALIVSLQNLIMHGLVSAPRDKADIVGMGFALRDEVRTSKFEVTDSVEIDRIENGTTPGSHEHYVYYRVAGRKNRSKSPYYIAVFQVSVRADGEDPPDLNNDADWGHDEVSPNEPFKRSFPPADDGKRAWYRARWESRTGKHGPWSMSNAEVP